MSQYVIINKYFAYIFWQGLYCFLWGKAKLYRLDNINELGIQIKSNTNEHSLLYKITFRWASIQTEQLMFLLNHLSKRAIIRVKFVFCEINKTQFSIWYLSYGGLGRILISKFSKFDVSSWDMVLSSPIYNIWYWSGFTQAHPF